MAKGEARGYKKFVPSITRIVQILIVLIILKVVTKYAIAPQVANGTIPASVAGWWPMVTAS